jgi:hypothetical protein
MAWGILESINVFTKVAPQLNVYYDSELGPVMTNYE